jgi:hypothetical protein
MNFEPIPINEVYTFTMDFLNQDGVQVQVIDASGEY